MADLSQGDVDALVQTVAAEAGNQSPVGQQAVASVILNRSNMSGQSPAAVVAAPHQFEGYGKGQAIAPGSAAYNATLQHVLPVLTGDAPDPTGGATHYLNPQLQAQLGRAQPAWAGAGGQRIGDHVFYHGTYGAPSGGSPGALPAPSDLPGMSSGGATLPSPSDLASWTGQGGGGASASAAVASAAPAAMPSPDQLGMAPPPQAKPAGPAPLTADQKAAQTFIHPGGASTKAGSVDDIGQGVATLANGFLGGGLPMAMGGLAAAQTGVQGALHGLGIGGAPQFSSAGAAYNAVRAEQQHALAGYAQAHPNDSMALGAAGFGAGLIGDAPMAVGERLATKGATAVAEHVLPAAVAKAAPVVGRVAGQGALGAGIGLASGLSAGDTGGQLGADVAENAGGQAALGGVFEAAKPVLGAIPTTAGRALVGAGGGAGLAALLGGNPVQGAGVGALAGLTSERIPMLAPNSAEAQAAAAPKAVATLSDKDIANLEAAPDGALAGEALGSKGTKIVSRAADENPTLQPALQSAVDSRALALPDRVSDGLATATGITPETAAQDVTQQIGSLRSGPAADAYAKALTGEGKWSPELADQLQRPEVSTAYRYAKAEMQAEGLAPEVANPAYDKNAGLEGSGPLEVSPEVYRAWKAEGTNDPARLVAMASDAVGQPKMIPTDEALERTKRYLDQGYSVGATDAANRHATVVSKGFRNVITPMIPGIEEARQIGGEAPRVQAAYDMGVNTLAAGKNTEPLQAMASRFSAASPSEQAAERSGFMADLYRRAAEPSFNPSVVTESPKAQAKLSAMFAPDQVAQINATLRTQSGFKVSGSALVKAAEGSGPSHGAVEGAIIGGADHLTPMGAVKGALGGLGVDTVKSAARKGFTTKAQRAALAHFMAAPAADVAAAARQAKVDAAKDGRMPRTLREHVVRAGVSAAKTGARYGVAHALSPLSR